MKKFYSLALAVLLALPMFVSGQVYQLPNGGFELWDNNYSSTDDEPTNWNSFPSADCTVAFGCAAATATRHERSTDKRPGSTGQYSCKIFATVVDLGITSIPANGNITTGRIHIGSTSAANEANHNVSQRPNYAQPFNAKPDSIVFWAKFSCPNGSQFARMTAVFHDNYDMHDPIQTADQSHVAGYAKREFTQTGSWVRYSVPVTYTGYPVSTPQYLLMTFTTNKEPGQGSSSDYLWIDDIEMIYNANLSDLRSNEVTVPAFDPNTTTYNIVLPYGSELPVVSATAASHNASVTITQPTASNMNATVVVNHGDLSKTYTIHYSVADPDLISADLADLRVNGETVMGFDPATTSYSAAYFVDIPVVTATPLAAIAQVEIEQATSDNLVATVTVTCDSLQKVYTVAFTSAPLNTNLADLQVDYVTIPGFNPNTSVYTYVMPYGSTAMPVVTATAESELAEVAITQATEVHSTAIVLVSMGNLTKTYVVHFELSNGIVENGQEEFMVYPNPSDAEVNVVLREHTQASEIVLYNVAGQIISTTSVKDSRVVLNVRDLKSGIYFIFVKKGNVILGTEKVVKR